MGMGQAIETLAHVQGRVGDGPPWPGPWELVRRFYGVPARRGMRITFRGLKEPLQGRLTYCSGQYLWMRTDEGKKVGPLHPTWEIEYAA